jgi:hypothetical protein
MSGQTYPRTWTEFLELFSSEDACLAYQEGLRGRTASSARAVAASLPYRASRIRMMCKDCGHQSTVTAGTIFDKTTTPLRVWLAAAWYLTHQKQGVSALGNPHSGIPGRSAREMDSRRRWIPGDVASRLPWEERTSPTRIPPHGHRRVLRLRSRSRRP